MFLKEYFKVKSQESFTIIESMIAVSIIVIAFTAITQLFPFALKIESSSEMKTKAIGISQAKIEDFAGRSYSEIKCGSNNPPCEIEESQLPEDPSFKRVTRITFVDPQNNFLESSSDTGIKKIEVTVYWKSNFSQGEDSYKLTTFFSQR